jgi:hypothetical protein
MTNKEIPKGFEYHVPDDYSITPTDRCMMALDNALDLINRQQAEIERMQIRLRKERHQFADLGKMYSEIRAEAIKEFAEKLADVFYSHDKGDTYVREVVYNLVKEMVGDDKC